jgi:hypothetical protein
MLEKFIAGDFIAIAGEMRRFPASNENTAYTCKGHDFIKKTTRQIISIFLLKVVLYINKKFRL